MTLNNNQANRAAAPRTPTPLWGVVEGFYGRPWTPEQRLSLLKWMSTAGLNAYFYSPKDDPKHRTFWYEPYSREEGLQLASFIRQCRAQGIAFIYGIAPGLHAEFDPKVMERRMRLKVEQVRQLGCRDFAFLFDDIPAEGSPVHLARYGTWSGAHIAWAHLMGDVLRKTDPQTRLLFCPTPYCSSFAGPLEENEYLNDIGARLDSSIGVLWTGEDIVSRTITVDHLQRVKRVLRRRPVLWDNLFANDYDLRRIYFGPYGDRNLEIRNHVEGIFLNPNCEFHANHVPFHTFASFVRSKNKWKVQTAYRAAQKDWRLSFRTQRGGYPSARQMEILTDCFFLPYTQGTWARALLVDVSLALSDTASPGRARADARTRRRIQEVMDWHVLVTELENRDLCYTLYRYVWELKEELDLIRRYLDWRSGSKLQKEPFRSIFHQSGTYRGGLVARLQSVLSLLPDNRLVLQKKKVAELCPGKV